MTASLFPSLFAGVDGMLYSHCKHAGVMEYTSHGPELLSGVRPDDVKFMIGVYPYASGNLEILIKNVTDTLNLGSTHEVVGCTKLRWLTRSVGIEYESVLTVCLPVAGWVNTEKSASRMSLAVLTGI